MIGDGEAVRSGLHRRGRVARAAVPAQVGLVRVVAGVPVATYLTEKKRKEKKRKEKKRKEKKRKEKKRKEDPRQHILKTRTRKDGSTKHKILHNYNNPETMRL